MIPDWACLAGISSAGNAVSEGMVSEMVGERPQICRLCKAETSRPSVENLAELGTS